MKVSLKCLKYVRIALAAFVWMAVTLLFLDFTGTIHQWFGWMAKIQFLPALLALNFGVVVVLLLLTIIFGRIYCSIICPLGIMQDILAWMGTRSKKKRNKYHYTKARNILRYVVLGAFAVLMFMGLNSIAILIAPYSAYGRIVQNLFKPIYLVGNNFLAYISERLDSYAFYPVEIYIKSLSTLIIALITFIVIAVLAWRGGRTWCNTICPIGTLLGTISKYSLFKPVINREKCVKCHMCEKRCKAACINIDEQMIDASRCVACMNCINDCHKGAIQYQFSYRRFRSSADEKMQVLNTQDENIQTAVQKNSDTNENGADSSDVERISVMRRGFLASLPALAVSSVAMAQDKLTDGGLAELQPRQQPARGDFSLKPAGSKSYQNFSRRCTACQLCVTNCPNDVLRPSNSLLSLMQPEMGFDKGFCRPECTRCSDVCPTGAIQPIGRAEKSSIQIGHAAWEKSLCLPFANSTKCGNCARHCPNGAIEMIEIDAPNGDKIEVPSVDTERCIGCGACEYVCPVRPVSAIHIVGHEVHKEI